MEERERGGKLSPEIYVYATSKHFFNVYDALRISKIKVEIAGYDPTTNRQTGHATAWLDLDDARLLCHLVCQRLFAPVTGGKWEKFGGSQREDSSIESRSVVVEWDEGDGGRFARFPYRISIANGPGRKTATGGVSPAGEPTSRMSMRMPELDFMKLMLTVGDYIHAYETAHHHRLVAERMRELREKLAGRASNQSRPSWEGPQRDAEPTLQTSGAERPGDMAVPAGRPVLKAIPGGNRARESARVSRLDSTRAG